MELNLTTFILETVNFLVLVWILKRLFYAPMRRIIADRRAGIEKKLQDAEKTRTEAEEMHLKYENRLRDWELEKARERESFQKGLEDERARQMKLLEESLRKERERIEAKEEQRIVEIIKKNEREAVRQSLAFLSRFLGTFPCPEIEGKIVDLVLKAVSDPDSPETRLLRSGFMSRGTEVTVKSAFSLGEGKKGQLAGILKSALGGEPPVIFQETPELLAGLEVVCGSTVLQANLRDELRAFAEVGQHG